MGERVSTTNALDPNTRRTFPPADQRTVSRAPTPTLVQKKKMLRFQGADPFLREITFHLRHRRRPHGIGKQSRLAHGSCFLFVKILSGKSDISKRKPSEIKKADSFRHPPLLIVLIFYRNTFP